MCWSTMAVHLYLCIFHYLGPEDNFACELPGLWSLFSVTLINMWMKDWWPSDKRASKEQNPKISEILFYKNLGRGRVHVGFHAYMKWVPVVSTKAPHTWAPKILFECPNYVSLEPKILFMSKVKVITTLNLDYYHERPKLFCLILH